MKTDGMFVKLMMMTTSNSDGEALTALRKANKILADAKVSWSELLAAPKVDNSYRVPPSKRPKPEPDWNNNYGDARYTGDEIDRWFNVLFNQKNMSEGFSGWVESVHIWWEQHGWLTEKQYNALKKSAER